MDSVITWTTVGGCLILGVCFMRLLGVVYRNGKIDTDALSLVRSASLWPLTCTVAALVLPVAIMALRPDWVSVLTWAMVVLAVGGAAWAIERGIRRVRSSRI